MTERDNLIEELGSKRHSAADLLALAGVAHLRGWLAEDTCRTLLVSASLFEARYGIDPRRDQQLLLISAALKTDITSQRKEA